MIIQDIIQTSDETDRASLVEQSFTEHALEAARSKALPETHPDFDGTHCVDCDEPIPKARRDLGKVRCVTCQEGIEKHARLYAT